MTRTSCVRKPHCLSRRHIVSPEDTLSLPKTHCRSRRHTCLPRRHIVSSEDTLSLRKKHCLSGKNIVSPEKTLSLRKKTLSFPKIHCLSRSGILSLLQPCSLPRSEPSQQAIDRASERQASDERQSLLRRKTCAQFKANTQATTKLSARPKAF